MTLNLRVVYSGSVGSIPKFFGSIKPNETVLVLDGRRSTYISEEGANAQVKKRGAEVALDWILKEPKAVRFFAQHFAKSASDGSEAQPTLHEINVKGGESDLPSMRTVSGIVKRLGKDNAGIEGIVEFVHGEYELGGANMTSFAVFTDPKFIVR